METPVKHYKFVNSKTGNAIYYYSLSGDTDIESIKNKLDTIKADVAVVNGVFLDTIYWEEIKDED